MNDQEHKDSEDPKVHPEDQLQQNNDNSFKKVAMATFGAISGAVEKMAKVIDDATSPENLDKFAKKGEESMAGIKDASGKLAKQVKEFGNQTIEKVKGTKPDQKLKQYPDLVTAEQALQDELAKLEKTAKDAQKSLGPAGADQTGFKTFKAKLSQDLEDHRTHINALLEQLIGFHQEEISETAHVDVPADSEVPYDTKSYPRSVYDRSELVPADYEKASQVAPDRENNTVVLETDSRNDHLDQVWPPEKG